MTADEIRKQQFLSDDGAWECARWLQEIAAQVAERNEKSASDYAILSEQMKSLNQQMDMIAEELKAQS